MSFIHYLLLGCFEHDGDVVRFSKGPSDPVYRPVLQRPIDSSVVKAVLHEVTGAEVDDLAFPEDWPIWLDAGYLICDKYTRNRAAIHFITRLVERAGCDIYDVNAHCDIALRDWLTVIEAYANR